MENGFVCFVHTQNEKFNEYTIAHVNCISNNETFTQTYIFTKIKLKLDKIHIPSNNK